MVHYLTDKKGKRELPLYTRILFVIHEGIT